MQPFPVLETPRLQLREIVPEDAPAILAIHGDAEGMRWYGKDPLPDLEAAEKLIQAFAKWREAINPGARWGIELKQRPGLIGTCGVFTWNRLWRKCALVYELAREARGQGYMREALLTVLPWAFESMELNRIEATVHPNNRESIRLLEKLGFEYEGGRANSPIGEASIATCCSIRC